MTTNRKSSWYFLFFTQIPKVFKKQPEWGPALEEDRAIDPDRYPPLNDISFSNLAKNGTTNLAYVGDGKVKYIPPDVRL